MKRLFILISAMGALLNFSGRALAEEAARRKEPRVGQIEESEKGKYRTRFQSLNLTSIGFGPFNSANTGEGKVMYGLSYGKLWDLRENWNIRLDFLGAFNADGTYLKGDLGLDYLFTDTDFSPFVGGMFGYGYAHGNDNDKGAFAGTAEFGMRFFRLSETQLEVTMSYSTLFTNSPLSVYGLQLKILY